MDSKNTFKELIDQIDDTTIKRYNKRFEEYGIEAKTLGWGSKEDQIVRFETTTTYTDFAGKTVLDIGCGFADFYQFLCEKEIPINEYRGIDINAKLIEVAKNRFPENQYDVKNILINNYDSEQADIVTLFGLLNFKLENDNLKYTKDMLAAAWKITKETLIVDFLSTHLTTNYPKEDIVYYHNPIDVLDICFELSDNLLLVHDYQPIPQKEFMIVLRKNPSNGRG